MTSTLAARPAGLWNYDANDRLTTDTYDADGNTTWSAGVQNTYDFENHLASWGFITYVYDGDGNRVAKTIGGATTNYLVDTLNPTSYAQVLDELHSGTVTRSYTWGLQLVSESQQTNAPPPASTWTTSYYGFDGHGSVRFLADSTGAVTDTYDYDAFGNLINSTGSTPNNYLFAGEQFHPDISLYYNRARYLDVRRGRFWGMDTDQGTSQDPASLHKYLYASGNPVNRIDPSGHDDIGDVLGALAVSVTIFAMSTMANAPTTSQTRVEVHFDKLGGYPIYGDFYHAFLLVFKAGLPPFVFRAGPSVEKNPDQLLDTSKDAAGAGNNEMLGFGYLTTGGCANVAWTAATNCDFPRPGNPNDDVAKMTIPVNPALVSDLLRVQLVGAANYIDSLWLPYHPISQNSNSFVHTLIKHAGLGDPPPPVNAPGWDHILY